MNKDRWQQVGIIVDQLLELDSERERSAFLSIHCENDRELHREVQTLFDSIKASEGLWDELLLSNRVLVADMTRGYQPVPGARDDEVPERIGLYRIKERLGHGGMGDVFLAERIEGDFHSDVALKVIKKEAGNKEQIRRFIQERTILSSLNHPNIARLLDGGISNDGRPYLVMEYVDGMPITDYCRKNNCDIDERLALFGQVCRAVQYAHSNFIVHRDLKPDNLLVTAEGRVKVLDFGIAKLLDRELSEQTLLQTQAGQRMLSLNYAAPEQVTMEPVTTATDVYALGLLLYELLTGTRAFDLSKTTLREAEQIIRQKEPERPSFVVDKGKSEIKGDLDAIVSKALRKEPGERYESASRLLEDVERYQKNKPVQARKGTFRYRTGKFIKRHKTALAATLLFLITALAFSSYHVYQIAKERNIAELEARKARKVSDFLIGVFENANPWQQPNTEITALEILDRGVDYINNEFTSNPEIKASLLGSVGEIYEALGSYDKGDSLLNEAIKTEHKLLKQGKGNEYDLSVNQFRLGKLKSAKGNYKAAINLLGDASASFQKLDQKKDRAAGLLEWGWAEYRLANYNKADSLISLAFSINQNLYDEGSIEFAKGLQYRAWLEHDLGNYHNADSLFNKVLSIHRITYDGDHPATARTLHSLAWIKYQVKDYDNATSLLEEALNMRKRLFSNRAHPDVAWSINNLGLVKLAEGKLEEAEKLFKNALTMRQAVLSRNHPMILQSMGNLGSIYFQQENYQQSIQIFGNILDIQREILGSDHPDLALYLNNLATVLNNAGRKREALPHYHEALAIQKKHFKTTHSNTLRMRDNTADVYEDLNQFKEAEELRLENLNAIKQEKGIEHRQAQLILKNIVTLYEKWGQTEQEQKYRKLLID